MIHLIQMTLPAFIAIIILTLTTAVMLISFNKVNGQLGIVRNKTLSLSHPPFSNGANTVPTSSQTNTASFNVKLKKR